MVHGVDAFDVRELEILPPLEMWVLRDHSRIRRKGCVGGERDLAPGDVMQIEGLRLTTPCRTALDLGCRLPPRQAMAALDAFTRLHNITREELKAELPRYRRRRGVVQLRQLVSLADPRLESAGESWTRLCIIDEGPPPPEPQYWVEWEGRRVRLDLAYPRHKIMIEYDGIEYHGSSAQKVHDEARRKWLRRQGGKGIVVRKDSFGAEPPGPQVLDLLSPNDARRYQTGLWRTQLPLRQARSRVNVRPEPCGERARHER